MAGAHELEKELTETDVGHKLVVPVRWLDEMPPFEGGCREVQFGVLDDKGFHFPLCCSIRNGGYRKPVLQAEGWLRFVNYKGLKVGDKIIFRPQPKTDELEKKLTKTDVGHKLVVPGGWLNEMPPFEGSSLEVQFGVLDDRGFHFLLCCSIRNGGYQKPVLQAEGWLKFVKYKGLKVGDKIIFRPQVDHFRETIFQVRAQRQNIDGHWVDI